MFLVKALLVYTSGWANTAVELMLLPEETTQQMKLDLLNGWPLAGHFDALGHCCLSKEDGHMAILLVGELLHSTYEWEPQINLVLN